MDKLLGVGGGAGKAVIIHKPSIGLKFVRQM